MIQDFFEAASIDGANRFKQILHITVPALLPTVVLMTALNLGNILNAGFDQVFNLYNPLCMKQVISSIHMYIELVW